VNQGSTEFVPRSASRRGRQWGRVFGAGMAVLALAGASIPGSAAFAESRSIAAESSDAEINRSLDALAKAFASTVSAPEVRESIHDTVAERFDGDTNVLWKTLANEPGVRSGLSASYSRDKSVLFRDARVAVDRLASSIPRLQIAVPANFESWDPATYTPLVAFMPQGVDDTTLKTVTAYDSAGNATELDAQIAPKVPVIMLGLNERTDDDGQLLGTKSEVSAAAPAAGKKASYQARVVQVLLRDNKEPWTSGSAEISMKARSRGCSGVEYTDTDWSGLNNNLDIWAGARDVGNTTCDVVFYWWEDDGGSYDFTLAHGAFGLGVKMDNSDDLIGGAQLPYSSFNGGSNRVTEWSALVMWTD
jgi:hypothetical protein